MIEILNARFKNFLSFGNTWTHFDFMKSRKTLILGANGQGKSTLLDVIVFALFGKPYRKINKGGLVNSINKRDLMVELEFRIKDKIYEVKRGASPSVFEIYVDDVMIPQDASVRDYQKVLENDILNLNYNTFTQIVILGSSNYTQFMKLSSSAKRVIIEDILDISVFSRMNEILKAEAKEEFASLNALSSEMSLRKEQYKFILDKSKKTTDSKTDRISKKKVAIEELESEIQSLELKKGASSLSVEEVEEDRPLKVKKQKLEKFKVGMDNNHRQATEEIKFYSDHDTCPKCKKVLDDDFKEERVSFLTNKRKELETALSKLKAGLSETVNGLNSIASKKKQNRKVLQDINKIDNEISRFQSQIGYLEADIKEIEEEDISIVSLEEIEEMKIKVQEVDKQIQEKHKTLRVMKLGLDVLKDKGAKTSIIKFYLPLINRTINEFLEKFDFNVSFFFDENFEESIHARYIDTFSYGNFSEGEKKRIDLALMFTWREIAKMKNSASTNLLFFDEVLDSAMDGAGLDNFMKIVDEFDPTSNLFIISHRDGVETNFDSVVTAVKQEQFSEYIT